MYLDNYQFIFETGDQARDALDKVVDLAARYGYVSVADLCELAGICANYLDDKYYWTIHDIRMARILDTANGFELKIPEPKCGAKVSYRQYNDNKPKVQTSSVYGTVCKNTSEPLNITIRVNEIDVYDPDEIISSVIKHISQIKNRKVSIVIE